MNMIVNTSDLVGYEAENIAKATKARSEALAKAVAIWENNQFKSAKRLGGFGMLAITLAACNNDDDDTAAADVAVQLAAAQAAQAAAEAAQAAAEAALADINAVEAAAAVVVATPAAVAVLTTGVDTVVAAASGDSLSSGLVAGVQALQSIDAINMGEGNDTLTAIVNAAVSPQMTGVENLIVSSTTNAVNLNLSAAPGITSIHNNGSSTILDVQNIEAGTALALSNNTAGSGFTLKAADFTGAADSITLSLNNATLGNTTISAGVETMNIVSNGTSTNVLNTVTIAPTTVNISGVAALTYAEGLTTTTTVDASAMSGTLTSTWAPAAAYSYTGGSGIDTLTLNSGAAIIETVNLGAGNDKVTVSANLADTDVLTGGDGTDTISGSAANLVALTTLVAASNNITGFETVQTTDALDRAMVVASDVQSTGITSFTSPGTNANDNAVVTMAAGDMTVNLSASLAGTLGVTDTGTATTDSVTFNNTALAADDMGDAEALNITGYETASIVANSVGGVTSQDFGLITMTVDTGGTGVLNITGNSPMTANGTTGIATIDASGMTGEGVGTATFTMGAVGTGATTITGSPGRDTLLAAATATTLNGGAGNDVLTGGVSGDTINGGDGIDTITAGAGTLATTVDTIDGGAGNDIITMGQGTSVVDGGAGDDTVDMVSALSTGDVIKGGEGFDTLRTNVSPTAAIAGQVSGFERIRLDLDTGTVNFATMGANGGFTTATASALTTTFSNATTAVIQLELDGGADTISTFSRLVDGLADTLDIETTATEVIANLSIVHEEIVTIDAADGALTISTAFTNTDMTSLTASGDNAVDLGTSTGVSIATIDASAMTASFTMVAASSVVAMTVKAPATAAGVITSGAGADTVTGGSGGDNFTTGNGADVVTLAGGNDTVNTGAGNDTITNTSGTGAITGGIGSDTFTGGSGVDTYVQGFTASTAPTSFSIAAGIAGRIVAGDSLTFANGVDIINGFGISGTLDIINTGAVAGATATTTGINVGTVLGNNLAGADDVLDFSGAWDATAKTFTFTNDGLGPDTLFADVNNGAASDNISTSQGLTVLIGVDSDNLAAANFT